MTQLPIPPNNPEIMRYTALMSQLGTDVPTVRVMQNTLRDLEHQPIDITWTRQDQGAYISEDEFDNFNNSNTIIFGGNQTNGVSTYQALGVPGATPIKGYWTAYSNEGQIQIKVIDNAGAAADLSEIVGQGEILIDFAVYRDKLNPNE